MACVWCSGDGPVCDTDGLLGPGSVDARTCEPDQGAGPACGGRLGRWDEICTQFFIRPFVSFCHC